MSVVVVFEGLDYAGKSSLALEVKERLTEAGYDCILVNEPGCTPLGEHLRTVIKYPCRTINEELDPKARILLLNTARYENIRKNILPALEEGKIVLVDRWLWTTIVYENHEYTDFAKMLHHEVCQDMNPNYIFYCDIDFNSFIERRGERDNSDEIEDRIYGLFDEKRTRYLQLADEEKNCRIFSAHTTIEERAKVATKTIRDMYNYRRRKQVK